MTSVPAVLHSSNRTALRSLRMSRSTTSTPSAARSTSSRAARRAVARKFAAYPATRGAGVITLPTIR